METKLLTKQDTAAAAEILKRGGLVAIPTETVYGLAADAFNETAVRNIFIAKGRPQDNPLIAHIAAVGELSRLCADVPPEALLLAEKFWPGPLTMVLPRRPEVPDAVTAGLDTVAVRFPSHPLAQAVIAAAGTPLAAPSANLSGSPSPTTAAHVMADLGGRIDAVLDGGACEVGLESTVVSLAGEAPVLLRPGGVTHEQLTAALGPVVIDKAVRQKIDESERVSSPGMKYRHYAPKAPVQAVCGGGAQTAAYIRSKLTEIQGRCCVICYDEYARAFSSADCVAYGSEADPAALAHGLFGALRAADALKTERIYIQCPSDGGIGLAVANRIKKAAGFDVVTVS
ncbi:MAG: threonylcarbamoyl-AMP synthase [Clostridiales bacterium]|nr:MAG: threonylcarbamoyl-AMP synthase [Clostridiales bacterium]